MSETTNSKVLTLLIIDQFLPLKFHIPITFSLKKYFADCIVMAKIFLDLAKGPVVVIFMSECSYWLCWAKDKHNTLWNDQTRQATEKTFQRTPSLVNQCGLQRLQRRRYYLKVSNIRRIKCQNVNDSRLVLQLSMLNPQKPSVKSIMKM